MRNTFIWGRSDVHNGRRSRSSRLCFSRRCLFFFRTPRGLAPHCSRALRLHRDDGLNAHISVSRPKPKVNIGHQNNECYMRNVRKKRCTRASSAAGTLTEVTALVMRQRFHVGVRLTVQKSCSLRTSRRTCSVRETHFATTSICLALMFFTCFATATTAKPSLVTNPGAIGPHDLWHLHVTPTSRSNVSSN